MAKAVDYFQRAIDTDPDYALPWAGLADVYITQAYHGVLGREEAVSLSRAAVARALEIDSGLAEALAASAEIKYLFEWDWEGADEDLRRAIETNPGSDFARISYAYYLSAVGRFDEAIDHATIAKELDPLSPSAFHLVAFSLMGKHEYVRAAEEFRAALDLNPNWTWGYIKLAKTYADSGLCEQAFATAESAEAELHDGGTPLARSWLGYTYAKCGDATKTEAALATLDGYGEERASTRWPTASSMRPWAKPSASSRSSKRSVDPHSMLAVFMPGVPAYYMPGNEDDPRFQKVMERVGFTGRSARRRNEMRIEPGMSLSNYRVVDALGVGGMGEVWRAEDEKLGREVALKVLPDEFAEDPERMARFEREAKVLASLNHPNIAHLYGLESVDSQMAAGTAAPQGSQD